MAFSVRSLGTVLAIAMCIAAVVATAGGAVGVPWYDLIPAIANPSSYSDSFAAQLLYQVRLPRVLFALLVGAALSASGVIIQALFRNPLAEPGLMGISTGAALGAVAAIVLSASGFFFIAASAFVGSLVATYLAYLIGRRFPGVAGLLLAGIAINAAAGSVIGVFTYMANDAQLRDLTFWGLGSLAGASWSVWSGVAPWVLLLLLYALSQWKSLNALLLGEREALHLGFELAALRRRLIIVVALLVGPLVALTGGIAFVGLVVPHIVRLLVGAQHRYLLPFSMMLGAVLLCLADWLSRTIIAPAELPIGLVTSLLGGPFFFALLLRGGQRPQSEL